MSSGATSISMDNNTSDREASADFVDDDFNGTANNSSTNSPTASANAAHTRRSHKKSRNGCSECKRRHIRCDERRPACANCDIAERACSFPPPKRNKPRQRKKNHISRPALSVGSSSHHTGQSREPSSQRELTTPRSFETQLDHRLFEPQAPNQPQTMSQIQQTHNQSQTQSQFQHLSIHNNLQTDASPSAASSQPHTHTQPNSPFQPDVPTSPEAPPLYSSQHLVLLHHAATALDNSTMVTSQSNHMLDIAVRWAVGAPYLMDQVLAISALHLATQKPTSAVSLRHLATELQTRAVASFTRSTECVSVEDTDLCVPRFLFAGILNLHVLTETLTHHSSQFHTFIDRFVECIHLHRGIMSLIRPNWDFLEKSELQPLIAVTQIASSKIKAPGSECDKLHQLMDSSDLSTASISACQEAIKNLQWAFDTFKGMSQDHRPRAASSFSVKAGAEFVDVLRKHRPEALVILAYYGVLLHRCRDYWAYGDSGAAMIRAISRHLGSFWRDAIAWPLEVLDTEHD